MAAGLDSISGDLYFLGAPYGVRGKVPVVPTCRSPGVPCSTRGEGHQRGVLRPWRRPPLPLRRPLQPRSSLPSDDPDVIALRAVDVPSTPSSTDVDEPHVAAQMQAYEILAENHREERRGKVHVPWTLPT